jgi:hypothetical protein
MKYITNLLYITLVLSLFSCNQSAGSDAAPLKSPESTAPAGGQENVQDNESAKFIVKVAVSSKDHTTLVAALNRLTS